jgi:hypothetical protein
MPKEIPPMFSVVPRNRSYQVRQQVVEELHVVWVSDYQRYESCFIASFQKGRSRASAATVHVLDR